MSIKDEPHYTIAASELATWLERQDEDSWWSVDGDPLLMGAVSFPCPAGDLGRAIRQINRPLLLLCNEQGANGRHISTDQIDATALKDAESDNRVFTLSWASGPFEDEWVLAEDREAARVGRAAAHESRRVAGG